MSLTRKIAHNTAIQIIGKIISTILGLLAIGMMTRYLGQEKFGWYITVIAFLQFIGIMTDFGMTVVTAQMLSEPKHDKKQLFKNLLGFRFATSFVFLGLAPLIALFFPYPVEVKIAIGFTTISFLAIAMNQIFVGLYQTKLKMHITAIGEVIGRIVLVGGIWFFMQKNSSFLPIMSVVVFSSLAYTFFLWFKAQKETQVSFGFDWLIWKSIIIKMWPIAISIIFNVVYLKGDIILLSLFVSQNDIGIYGAAYRVLDVVTQSAMMIMGVLLPLLAFSWSHKLKQEFKKRYQQSFDLMMVLAVPMAVGTIALADKIMTFIAGENFANSGKILAILSIAVFGVFLGAVFGHTAVAINKQKQTLWIYISNAIITLIGYIIFIPIFGMFGAAWMSVFSELYTGILLFLTVRHYAQESLNFKTFFKIIFASLTMYFVVTNIREVHVLLLILIGILIYAASLLLIGAISKKTILEIISLKN